MNILKALKQYFLNRVIPVIAFIITVILFLLILKNVSILDRVFLVMLSFIYLVVFFVIFHIRRTEKKIEGLKKISREPEPNEEILFVLKTLAGNASQYTERGTLNVVYGKKFEGKNQADFNVVLATLHASQLIKISRSQEWDEIISITDNGLLYYDKHRKRLKKK
jgi:Ca2+/Na+ antiporter